MSSRVAAWDEYLRPVVGIETSEGEVTAGRQGVAWLAACGSDRSHEEEGIALRNAADADR